MGKRIAYILPEHHTEIKTQLAHKGITAQLAYP